MMIIISAKRAEATRDLAKALKFFINCFSLTVDRKRIPVIFTCEYKLSFEIFKWRAPPLQAGGA
jgi:hypothetical protein